MKILLSLLFFVPGICIAQKYNFQGEYRLLAPHGGRAGDTVIESVNFISDSVRISYAVTPKSDKGAPRHLTLFTKWHITRQEKSVEADKATGKEIFYEQLDVTLADGRTIGYFEYASSLDEALRRTLPYGLTFFHNGDKYRKAE